MEFYLTSSGGFPIAGEGFPTILLFQKQPIVCSVTTWAFKWKPTRFFALPQFISGNRQKKPAVEFGGFWDQLEGAQFRLDQAGFDLETQFVAAGSELEALANACNGFIKQVEKLVGLATGQGCDESVFSGSIQLIEQSTNFLVGCNAQTSRILTSLRSYNLQIRRLIGMEVELHRAMMPLKIMQIFFRTESAPLGAEIQQMFHSLTEEIEGLYQQLQGIFSTKFAQLEKTHESIELVIKRLEVLDGSLQQAATTHKERIESSLSTLKNELISNRERDARLSRLNKDLAREVAQVVTGLQFQDIVTQKLQHVKESIPQIGTKFEEFKDAPTVQAAAETMQFFHQSCRLEGEQLQYAQDELAKAKESIRTSIQQVLAYITEMDSQCLSLAEFKLLTTSYDGMVQTLVDAVDEVRTLVAAAVAGAKQAYELLRPLGNLASDLTAIVRNMSARIHLTGLNAQVQAALAAQGNRVSGLEVLSAHTSEISNETNEINQRVAQELDLLAKGLAESARALEQLSEEGLAQQLILDDHGRQEQQRLHHFRDCALETLSGIGTSLEAIQEQANRTLGTIEFTRVHQFTLPELQMPLVALGKASERWLRSHGFNITDASLIEGFQRNYTMASERQVFANVMSSHRPPADAPSPTPSGANGEVEWFPHLSETGNSADGKTANAPVQITAEPTSAGQDFGANVELF